MELALLLEGRRRGSEGGDLPPLGHRALRAPAGDRDQLPRGAKLRGPQLEPHGDGPEPGRRLVRIRHPHHHLLQGAGQVPARGAGIQGAAPGERVADRQLWRGQRGVRGRRGRQHDDRARHPGDLRGPGRLVRRREGEGCRGAAPGRERHAVRRHRHR